MDQWFQFDETRHSKMELAKLLVSLVRENGRVVGSAQFPGKGCTLCFENGAEITIITIIGGGVREFHFMSGFRSCLISMAPAVEVEETGPRAQRYLTRNVRKVRSWKSERVAKQWARHL
jgi:hypothetical protein